MKNSPYQNLCSVTLDPAPKHTLQASADVCWLDLIASSGNKVSSLSPFLNELFCELFLIIVLLARAGRDIF